MNIKFQHLTGSKLLEAMRDFNRDPLLEYDGLEVSDEQIELHPILQKIHSNFGESSPRIFHWNHPDASAYAAYADVIFITSPKTHLSVMQTCYSERCNNFRMISDHERTARLVLHELAHATGPYERLNRFVSKYTGVFGPAGVVEEIVADTVSSNILKRLGWQSPAGALEQSNYVLAEIRAYERNTGRRNMRDELLLDAKPLVEQAEAMMMNGVALNLAEVA